MEVYNVTSWYSITNGTSWTSMNMIENAVDMYQATIPGYKNCIWVAYKIIAFDNNGNQAVEDKGRQYYNYHVIPELPSIPPFLQFVLLILALFMIIILSVAIIRKTMKPDASRST